MWPECEWQDGGKYCWRGKVAWAPYSEDDKPMVTDKDCPACNGTGEAAELTEQQAANILKSFHVHTYNPKPGETNYEVKVDGLIWYWGLTLKAALNAAAQAVKERGKI